MPPSQVSGLGMPYDYDGIMHYGATAFSKNGQPTIVRLNGAGPLGQRNGLSQIDAKQLNILYGCKGKFQFYSSRYARERYQKLS